MNCSVLGFIGLALLAAMPSASGQDHAPTATQCVADRNLWMAQITEYNTAEADRLNKGSPNRTAVMQLTFIQLNARAQEMGVCADVDPANADSYNDLLAQYGSARDDRYRFFILRHRLFKQMMIEDQAGRRN